MRTQEEEDAPLLIAGVVDNHGQLIFSRAAGGGNWPFAAFIINKHHPLPSSSSTPLPPLLRAEVTKRFVYYDISINLIRLLEGDLPAVHHPCHHNCEHRCWWLQRWRRRSARWSATAAAAGRAVSLTIQTAIFFSALYLVAVAEGGHRPCAQAFGADQFAGDDPEECSGMVLAVLLISYVQGNIGRGFGFGLPCASMAISLGLFLAGTRIYRYCDPPGKNPLEQLAGAVSNFSDSLRAPPPEESKEALLHGTSAMQEGVAEDRRRVLRLLPIWATCLLCPAVLVQSSTFFTKQGSAMDRRITPSFLVSPAALQSFISLSVIAFVPIYDSLFPLGLTMLQRIGFGMVLSVSAIAIAAKVETKRLQTAIDFGLVDLPGVAIPMNLWRLVPQYVLLRVSDKDLGLCLYMSIFGVGSFISGVLVLVIQKVSAWWGEDWFSDNLNRAHLDYFYWLLAAPPEEDLQ
ncbi:unnamed protein product [Spirodela intermedia]|uniref:Uncharacterized protein n=1 Tax=Spirodela intermedia TaxID=51605 RepID=A0A7I8JKP3_SPIIN|nr:unnamed protein product [Spirodela intermedia]CAA6670163.1 unnamed protein product [Spirodela intermedia]